MKELVSGEVGDFGIGYSVKVEEGQLKVSAVIDFVKLMEKGEAALPDGGLKPFELIVLEMAKQAVKAL